MNSAEEAERWREGPRNKGQDAARSGSSPGSNQSPMSKRRKRGLRGMPTIWPPLTHRRQAGEAASHPEGGPGARRLPREAPVAGFLPQDQTRSHHQSSQLKERANSLPVCPHLQKARWENPGNRA